MDCLLNSIKLSGLFLDMIILKFFKKVLLEKNLPKSFQCAVLTPLPKKGDLTLMKNWRPVAVLCSDYKIISKSNYLHMQMALQF